MQQVTQERRLRYSIEALEEEFLPIDLENEDLAEDLPVFLDGDILPSGMLPWMQEPQFRAAVDLLMRMQEGYQPTPEEVSSLEAVVVELRDRLAQELAQMAPMPLPA
jgi:hypothetical protein